MLHYTILFNPHASNGRGRENAERIRDVLSDSAFELFDMTKIESYADFFDGLSADERIVICGGDGTLNRFINDTADIKISNKIYYFAAGSGNDFLRDVANGHENELTELESYIRNLPTVTIDGKTSYFLNGIGYGIDGYCCEVGDKLRQKSTKPINYTAIAIKGLLFHFKPTNAVITVDGKKYTYKKVWIAPTMNGRYYGGGMMPTPAQNRLAEDGTVSTMVFHGTGKLRTLMIFPSIFNGTHIKHTGAVEILRGHDVTVEFDRPTPLQIDGETVLGVTSYRVLTHHKLTESDLQYEGYQKSN